MVKKRSEVRRATATIIKVEKEDTPEPEGIIEVEEGPENFSADDYEQESGDEEALSGEIIEEVYTPKRKKIKREPGTTTFTRISSSSGSTSKNYHHPRKFNDRWLTIPEVKVWIHPLRMDPHYVWCKYCKKKIRAHLTDMRVHNKTKKHQKNLVNARPEVPAEIPPEGDQNHHHQFLAKPDNNIVITFPSQKDSSHEAQEVIVVPVHPEGAASPGQATKELIIPASIGFIGCGNMAQALMNAFLAKGLVEQHLLMVSAPSNRNLDRLPSGIRTTNNNNRVVKECDIIFVCVKPQMLAEMIESLDPLERDHNPLFVSVVTGYNMSTLEQLFGSLVDAPRVVRTMPNTPCMIGQGCCVYALGNNSTESDAKVVQSMLNSVGFCTEVPEKQIDAVCGLAGSGPAYIYAAIEALADGGVKMGLPRQLSQSLAAHMVKGAAGMVLETGKHPGQLKDEVCSPLGTTIAAMHSLEKHGFRNALISAVETSASRSKELGSQ